jgi:hypothetical protein
MKVIGPFEEANPMTVRNMIMNEKLVRPRGNGIDLIGVIVAT